MEKKIEQEYRAKGYTKNEAKYIAGATVYGKRDLKTRIGIMRIRTQRVGRALQTTATKAQKAAIKVQKGRARFQKGVQKFQKEFREQGSGGEGGFELGGFPDLGGMEERRSRRSGDAFTLEVNLPGVAEIHKHKKRRSSFELPEV